jgi:hypothetical protein
MICEIIQGFKKFGWNKKNKNISSSKTRHLPDYNGLQKKIVVIYKILILN